MPAIFYRKLGKGYPVILIHGFCETHEVWDGIASGLSTKFEVLALDLPGFGNSPLPSTLGSINDVGAIVLDWLVQQKIEQPVVLGHSLGGYVALAMAKQNVEKFAGIGLIQSTAFPDSEEKKANRNKVIEFVKTHGTDPFIDTFVPSLFRDKKHPAIPLVDKIARATSQETLLRYTAAMRDRQSSVDFIKGTKRPILILGGDSDSVITTEATLEHQRLSDQVEVHLLTNVGHMAMYESPAETVKRIEFFVDKVVTSKI